MPETSPRLTESIAGKVPQEVPPITVEKQYAGDLTRLGYDTFAPVPAESKSSPFASLLRLAKHTQSPEDVQRQKIQEAEARYEADSHDIALACMAAERYITPLELVRESGESFGRTDGEKIRPIFEHMVSLDKPELEQALVALHSQKEEGYELANDLIDRLTTAVATIRAPWETTEMGVTADIRAERVKVAMHQNDGTNQRTLSFWVDVATYVLEKTDESSQATSAGTTVDDPTPTDASAALTSIAKGDSALDKDRARKQEEPMYIIARDKQGRFTPVGPLKQVIKDAGEKHPKLNPRQYLTEEGLTDARVIYPSRHWFIPPASIKKMPQA